MRVPGSGDLDWRRAGTTQGEEMKVAELQGELLDYWVARAADLLNPRVDDGFCWVEEPACDGDPAGTLEAAFSPSADWATAGPIIERERIAFVPHRDDQLASAFKIDSDTVSGERFRQTGPTPLVAVMRCYVSSKFGEEVSDTA
jgi:hypothetical protein